MWKNETKHFYFTMHFFKGALLFNIYICPVSWHFYFTMFFSWHWSCHRSPPPQLSANHEPLASLCELNNNNNNLASEEAKQLDLEQLVSWQLLKVQREYDWLKGEWVVTGENFTVIIGNNKIQKAFWERDFWQLECLQGNKHGHQNYSNYSASESRMYWFYDIRASFIHIIWTWWLWSC